MLRVPGGGLSLDPFVGTRETAVFDAPRVLGSPDFVEPAKDFELEFSFFLGSPARSLSVFLSRRSGVETLTTSSDTDKDPRGVSIGYFCHHWRPKQPQLGRLHYSQCV